MEQGLTWLWLKLQLPRALLRPQVLGPANLRYFYRSRAFKGIFPAQSLGHARKLAVLIAHVNLLPLIDRDVRELKVAIRGEP